jgi:hypothetical protein
LIWINVRPAAGTDNPRLCRDNHPALRACCSSIRNCARACHGNRVFIEVSERLRHLVPVDSSVFNVVLHDRAP